MIDRKLDLALRKVLKALVSQEIRLLKFKQTFTPDIILEEVLRSISDTKIEIIRLARKISFKERKRILYKMLRRIVDEEIDRAIKFREKRCLRCIHARFYDEDEIKYSQLPHNSDIIKAIGCDEFKTSSQKRCQRFVEFASLDIEGYLNEITFLYEFRERIEQIQEIWKDYFLIY